MKTPEEIVELLNDLDVARKDFRHAVAMDRDSTVLGKRLQFQFQELAVALYVTAKDAGEAP